MRASTKFVDRVRGLQRCGGYGGTVGWAAELPDGSTQLESPVIEDRSRREQVGGCERFTL